MDFNVVAVTPERYDELVSCPPETAFSMSVITDDGVLESQEYIIVGLCMVSDGKEDKEALKITNLRTGQIMFLEPEKI